MHYVDRVGLDYVKSKVVEDAANHKALYERLLYSLQGYQDPWAERVEATPKRRQYELISI